MNIDNRILVLGATGRTGRLLLRQALEEGYVVNILVRNKKAVDITDENLHVFEGNASDATALEHAIAGCSAIISTLNISRKNDFPWAPLRTPKDYLSKVMSNIIHVAPRHGIQRVIFTSAWGVGETKKDLPRWFRWTVFNSNIRFPYFDHEIQESMVKQSALQWTAVRPTFLSNSKTIRPVITSFNNKPRPKLFISRSSVASFMLKILKEGAYLKEAPVISTE